MVATQIIDQIMLDNDDIIGAVSANNQWIVLAANPYQWALDPRKLEDVKQPWNGLFRKNDDDIKLVLEPDSQRITLDELNALRDSGHYREQDLQLTVLVDFDRKLFVSAFYDQPLEKYTPQDWDSRFADPLPFAPLEIQKWWPAPIEKIVATPKRQALATFFRHLLGRK